MSGKTTRQHEEDPQGPTAASRKSGNARGGVRGLPWHPSQGGPPPTTDGYTVEWQCSPDEGPEPGPEELPPTAPGRQFHRLNRHIARTRAPRRRRGRPGIS